MALQSHNDSFALKAVTLSSLAEMCSDCAKLCWERTERVVENRSRAPKGWEHVFKSVAEERRQEDYNICEQKCHLVQRSCPDTDALRKYEALTPKQKKQNTVPAGVPSIQQISRCEHAVEDFSALLFTLAHKPSKVSFQKPDTQAGGANADTSQNVDDPNAPTEVHKKVLQGASANVDEAILRRWSKARKDREHMEEQGVLRTQEASLELKNQLKQEEKSGVSGSGTVPNW